jgi:hypothetical protein
LFIRFAPFWCRELSICSVSFISDIEDFVNARLKNKFCLRNLTTTRARLSISQSQF